MVGRRRKKRAKKKRKVADNFDSELDLELHCCGVAFDRYGLWNLKQDSSKGLPDRIFFKPGVVFFVEFKERGKKSKPYQQHVQKQLRKSGVGVYKDVDDVDKFVEVCNEEVRS